MQSFYLLHKMAGINNPACAWLWVLGGSKLEFLFEQAAGNAVFGCAVGKVADVIRLQQTVHDAPFRDIEGKEMLLMQAALVNELIILDLVAVDGMVFAKRAAIDPTVGKDKKVLGNNARTLKCLASIEVDLGISDVDASLRRFRRYLRHN